MIIFFFERRRNLEATPFPTLIDTSLLIEYTPIEAKSIHFLEVKRCLQKRF
jgi:hypothetical protein